jgi:signal peptidase II
MIPFSIERLLDLEHWNFEFVWDLEFRIWDFPPLRRLDMCLQRFLIAGLVLLLDQATKAIVVERFTAQTAIPVVPGLFRLVLVENTGMAFGLLNDSTSPLVFALLTLVSAALLGFVAYLLWTQQTPSAVGGFGLALILGGAAGNVVDRLARGKVIDFLDFYIGSHHWPAFNLADSGIVIGAALLLLDLFRARTADPGRDR